MERPLINNQRKSKGGKREGAGRPRGAVSKVTADLRTAAGEFTTDALNVLAQVMRESESDAARVAAANSILDRAHGKPRQAVEIDANVRSEIRAIEWRIVDPAAASA